MHWYVITDPTSYDRVRNYSIQYPNGYSIKVVPGTVPGMPGTVLAGQLPLNGLPNAK